MCGRGVEGVFVCVCVCVCVFLFFSSSSFFLGGGGGGGGGELVPIRPLTQKLYGFCRLRIRKLETRCSVDAV